MIGEREGGQIQRSIGIYRDGGRGICSPDIPISDAGEVGFSVSDEGTCIRSDHRTGENPHGIECNSMFHPEVCGFCTAAIFEYACIADDDRIAHIDFREIIGGGNVQCGTVILRCMVGLHHVVDNGGVEQIKLVGIVSLAFIRFVLDDTAVFSGIDKSISGDERVIDDHIAHRVNNAVPVQSVTGKYAVIDQDTVCVVIGIEERTGVTGSDVDKFRTVNKCLSVIVPMEHIFSEIGVPEHRIFHGQSCNSTLSAEKHTECITGGKVAVVMNQTIHKDDFCGFDGCIDQKSAVTCTVVVRDLNIVKCDRVCALQQDKSFVCFGDIIAADQRIFYDQSAAVADDRHTAVSIFDPDTRPLQDHIFQRHCCTVDAQEILCGNNGSAAVSDGIDDGDALIRAGSGGIMQCAVDHKITAIHH